MEKTCEFNVEKLDALAEDNNPVIERGFKISVWCNFAELQQEEFESEDHMSLPKSQQWENVSDVELQDSANHYSSFYSVAIVDQDTGLRMAGYDVNSLGKNTQNERFLLEHMHEAVLSAGLVIV